jgi:hypothetical protein
LIGVHRNVVNVEHRLVKNDTNDRKECILCKLTKEVWNDIAQKTNNGKGIKDDKKIGKVKTYCTECEVNLHKDCFEKWHSMTSPFSYLMLDITDSVKAKYSGVFARFLFRVFLPSGFASDWTGGVALKEHHPTENKLIESISSRFVPAAERLKHGKKCKLVNQESAAECYLCKITSIASVMDIKRSMIFGGKNDTWEWTWEEILSRFPRVLDKTKKASLLDATNQDYPVYLHQDCSEYWHSELVPYSRRIVSKGVGYDVENIDAASD